MPSSFSAWVRVLVRCCLHAAAAVLLLGVFASCTKRSALPPSSLAPDEIPDSVSPLEMAFEHKVGASPCPQFVGTMRFTRGTENADFDVRFTAGDPLLVRFGSSGPLTKRVDRPVVRSGEVLLVEIWFDCSRQTSFTAAVAVGDTDASIRSVSVRGTITR